MSINLENIKKKLKRTYKQLKAKLNRKKTRRKIYAIAVLLLLTGLGSGLAIRDVQAVRRARTIKTKQVELQNTKSNLEQVEKQKANTEHELKKKTDTENQLKQQVEQLNKDLQAKRASQIARGIPVKSHQPVQPIQSNSLPRLIGRAAIGGNGYTPGQCTWHVKNMKADLPNNLGNANQWVGRARAQGIPTGNTPMVGAAGMRKTGNHVVYVLQVRGSEVLISEMNYNWTPYAKRVIWKPANLYTYIY